MKWLTNFKNENKIKIKISFDTLNLLKNQKSSLLILVILKLLKISKTKTINSVELKNIVNISKSSFYFSLKNLIDKEIIKFENGRISLIEKTKSKSPFILINDMKQLENIGKITPKELILVSFSKFIIEKKTKKVKEKIKTKHNDFIHYKLKITNNQRFCRENCLYQTKETELKFNFFYSVFSKTKLHFTYIKRKFNSDSFIKLLNNFTNKLKIMSINVLYKFSKIKQHFYTKHSMNLIIENNLKNSFNSVY
ncbi:hypothetical protein [Mesomycoplasma lagogenitalium]|uniref:Uncharacterized protein n=1 Tax=Mesomycoplasma lagogenitalium TaxID=171286 RepID=A0ABY8LTC5_9BACT|nr:hypothetical protein [Mesomycoplasma lagogenitalium]WGI36497.1 hypothetical protein QEG99_03465 [Mesomycoplasma lagogenitalium]